MVSKTTTRESDPRVQRTRRLLQQALLELFAEKSFQSISVQDITERATVNRATFYAHFEDKYDLLNSYIREHFRQVLASKLSHASSLCERSLAILIQTVFDYLAQMHSHCRPSDRQFDPLIETTIQQELYEVLLDWLKHTPRAPKGNSVPVETIATVVSWAIFGTASQWSHGSQRPSADVMARSVLTVINEGLAHVVSSQ